MSPGPPTSSSGSTATAVARLATTSSRRRRTRSTSRPDSGESSDGAAMKNMTMPAAALLPVSPFAHTPSASHIALSPNRESVWPAT